MTGIDYVFLLGWTRINERKGDGSREIPKATQTVDRTNERKRMETREHRIACYRSDASKCSKYTPNARPRGPNRRMQITGRPKPHSYNQWSNLPIDRCRYGPAAAHVFSKRTLIRPSLISPAIFVRAFSYRTSPRTGEELESTLASPSRVTTRCDCHE